MSDSQVEALVARYKSDKAFAQELDNARSAEEALEIAKRHGFDVTIEEANKAHPTEGPMGTHGTWFGTC